MRRILEPYPIYPDAAPQGYGVPKHWVTRVLRGPGLAEALALGLGLPRLRAPVGTLDLNKRLPEAKTPDERTRLERRIASTDRQIDLLVYDLYGLTDEEIAIVEADGA